jgi:hypothetical protein
MRMPSPEVTVAVTSTPSLKLHRLRAAVFAIASVAIGFYGAGQVLLHLPKLVTQMLACIAALGCGLSLRDVWKHRGIALQAVRDVWHDAGSASIGRVGTDCAKLSGVAFIAALIALGVLSLAPTAAGHVKRSLVRLTYLEAPIVQLHDSTIVQMIAASRDSTIGRKLDEIEGFLFASPVEGASKAGGPFPVVIFPKLQYDAHSRQLTDGFIPTPGQDSILRDFARAIAGCASRRHPVSVLTVGFASSDSILGAKDRRQSDSLNVVGANLRADSTEEHLRHFLDEDTTDTSLVSTPVRPWPTIDSMVAARPILDNPSTSKARDRQGRQLGKLNQRAEISFVRLGLCDPRLRLRTGA